MKNKKKSVIASCWPRKKSCIEIVLHRTFKRSNEPSLTGTTLLYKRVRQKSYHPGETPELFPSSAPFSLGRDSSHSIPPYLFTSHSHIQVLSAIPRISSYYIAGQVSFLDFTVGWLGFQRRRRRNIASPRRESSYYYYYYHYYYYYYYYYHYHYYYYCCCCYYFYVVVSINFKMTMIFNSTIRDVCVYCYYFCHCRCCYCYYVVTTPILHVIVPTPHGVTLNSSAITGAGLLYVLTPAHIRGSLGVTSPSTEVTFLQAIGTEALLTFMMILAVMATFDYNKLGMRRDYIAAVAVGLAITVCHVIAVSEMLNECLSIRI